MMKNKKFAVFILSFGRPGKVVTARVLRESGYTGEIYIVCSDDDKTLPEYKKEFGDKVIVFSKKEMKGSFDIWDNQDNEKVVVYARNANFWIAKSLGIDYFLQLDDDYTRLEFMFDENLFFKHTKIKNIDRVFDIFVDFLRTTPTTSIAWSQAWDFIGWAESTYGEQGTYVKSFYSVMFAPSCVKVRAMGEEHRRLHHNIDWKCAVPVIIREKYKKTVKSEKMA